MKRLFLNQEMMMRFMRRMGVAAILSFTFATQTQAQTTYALSAGALYTFDAASPAAATMIGMITGIAPGQMIEGLDVRPLTGQLYALGYDRNTQMAQLYIVDPMTASATAVAPAVSLVLGPVGVDRLDVTFDFNPTVDRIRVISNRDYNYRLHPVTGAVVFTDTNLSYAAADVNAGVNPFITTGAYTNSYVGSTSTALYDIDLQTKSLTKQDPPNNGTLNTIGMLTGTIGKGNSPFDLDIYYNPMTQVNIAYAALNTNTGPDKFISLDLSTGMASPIATSIGGGLYIDDIACAIDRTYPELMGELGYALNTNNFLLSFDAANPSIIRTATPVTGITLNQSIVGMDFRPATGGLYALGYNNATGESQVYTINTATGVATAVNIIPTLLSLGGTQVGMDFNPVADKIRVVSANNMNYRLNTDGTLAFIDLNLAYDAADVNAGMDPSIGAGAYTNSYMGATTTSLYDYDNVLNVFALQSPPNDGKLITVGASGIMQSTTDVTSDIDIVWDGVMNTAYFSANAGTATFDHLYSVDLANGMTMDLGTIGYGIAVKNIAFAIDDPMRLAGAATGMGKLKVDVFPNPVHDLLTVKLYTNAETFTTIRVFDLFGNDTGIGAAQNVAAGGSVSVDVSPLVPGSYIVKTQSGAKTSSVTFIKL